jgi:hypothetical protein
LGYRGDEGSLSLAHHVDVDLAIYIDDNVMGDIAEFQYSGTEVGVDWGGKEYA